MTYKAFVSSTFKDLAEHRKHVIGELRKAGIQVDPMEEWTADSDEPKEFSQDRVDGCNLCVLLVAFRRGHVPDGETLSITQLEYEAAKNAGISILPYLLDEDANWKRKYDELDKDPEIRKWRTQIESAHGVEYFDHEPDSIKISGALMRWVQKRDKGTGKSEVPGELVPSAYLERLKDGVAQVELLGLDLKESITNGLPQIYVPAVTSGKEPDRPMKKYIPPEPILHRLGETSLYLPGDPGSGKSTFCQWVAYVVANGSVPEHEIPPSEELQEQLPESLTGRLPVLIRLRDFWGEMGCKPEQGDWNQRRLEKAINGWLDEVQPFGLPAGTFERNLEEGSLLLILDGVDEVPEEEGSGGRLIYPRHALLTGLADALPRWQKAGNRILVTSRDYGLSSAERRSLQLPETGLLPLDEDLQKLFMARWYGATDHARWHEYAEGLAAEMRNREELNELRRNPLLLTALCVMYKEGKHLPQDIYHLYNGVVNRVLYNRFRESDKERTRVRWRLEAVALGMHYGIDDESVRPTALAAVDVDELDRILAHYARENPGTEGGAEKVLDRREELLERSGLLLPRGDKRAEFYHQDFRDYLAAERWVREDRSLKSALEQFATNRDWRRMLGFLFAREVEASGGIDRPLKALLALKGTLSQDVLAQNVAAALLLADCLEIAAGKAGEYGLGGDWEEFYREVCMNSLEAVPAAADRNELFLALGRLGWDNRPGVGLREGDLPDIAWSEPIGPGKVEIEKHGSVSTDKPFLLALYPVTNIQFAAFIEADDGYRNGSWWEDLAEQYRPREPFWPGGNRPRERVNWFEAVAFCRWLTVKYREAGLLAADKEIRLPTEAEWQLAATDGNPEKVYPWGPDWDAERCNSEESQLNITTPVGIYPRGKSLTGLYDVSGNVWEWCANRYDDPEAKEIPPYNAEGAQRVIRGGSWDNDPVYLRSAYRSWDDAVYRLYFIGFRLAQDL